MYAPINYQKINTGAGFYNPSTVKAYNNEVFDFWFRALFQRACSTQILTVPWDGDVRDFLYYCLFRFGFVPVFDLPEYGFTFNPGTLSGCNWYYQFTNALVSNPALSRSLDLEIGNDCEILKLTPDYCGVFDVIGYYAEKLASMDNAINMSIINSKLAYLIASKNKAAAEALKKIFDNINKGNPAVFFDKKILTDEDDNVDPFVFLDRHVKESYILTDQLRDFQTILNDFDCEVGIPTIPYQKKERMVTSEAESRVIDAQSRSIVWFECLKESMQVINDHYETSLDVRLRYADAGMEAGEENERNESNDQGLL